MTLLSGAAAGATLPAGFQETVVFSGLTAPTVIAFASDGRVFVAEKSGLIKIFDNLTDSSPEVFADLRTKVHNYWDRGLLGLALHPNFPSTPYVYVLYTHDAPIGGAAPRWGSVGGTSDGCPDPPGGTRDGCVVSGRLSRLRASGNVMSGAEEVLIEDWFQQYPSHSVGALAFGNDGALYASGGDGASFNFVDYGQDGSPVNPGGDPPVGVGGVQTPPLAEGGALRSQDLRTSGDPVTLDGALLRLDPNTGAGLPDNPFAGSSDPNARRIVAYGLRNPFRFAIRPNSTQIWIGDVGWNGSEEINKVKDPVGGVVENFGWPCYEGAARQPGYESAGLDVCEDLYAEQGAVTAPNFEYRRNSPVVAGETCPVGSSSISAISFYPGGAYPASYRGGLFFADYSRGCMWVIHKNASGIPDPSTRETFATGLPSPVDLKIGPGGDLFYVDISGGTVRRIRYFQANRPPVAVVWATPSSGPAPLTVSFDGSGSSDPDPGDSLSFAWDLDGDGQYDDATSVAPRYTYTSPGTFIARLRVTDRQGDSSTASVSISADNTPPTARIDSPSASKQWRVGEVISFSGSATDPQSGNLPASALSWSLVLQHCPSDCHPHPLQTYPGVAAGSFTGQDHEYPSHMELRLTATDPGGLSDTRTLRLDPQTVVLMFQSDPAGLVLNVGGQSSVAPFARTVLVGSTVSLAAPSPQALGAASYEFVSWSDGMAQSHDITSGPSPGSFTAFYSIEPPAVVSSLTLTPASLLGGASSTGNRVTLNRTAPSGGTVVALSSSNTGIARVPAGVTVPAGSSSQTFTVNSFPVATETPVAITAAAGGVSLGKTLTVTPAAAVSSLNLTPHSVVGGAVSGESDVTLNGPAPPGGTSVALSSSNPSVATVPPSVTVPAGSSTAKFSYSTFSVAADSTPQITASAGGGSRTKTLTVTAREVLDSFFLVPASLVGGASSTGNRVSLNGPARPGGTVVTLTSSNPSAATVPASVTVPAGDSVAQFTVTTFPMAADTVVTITASSGRTLFRTLTVTR